MIRSLSRHIFSILLVNAALLLIVSRFVLLEHSPPGFFIDEVGCAAHVVCMRETGANCLGQKWPGYSVTFSHQARVTPVYLYLAWGWSELFGGSILSMRTFTAVFGLYAVLLIALLALVLGGRSVAVGTLFTGLLSPWGFHASRIAWEPPIAPAFMVATVLCFYLAKGSRHWKLLVILSGIFAASLLHLYTPAGAQVVALMIMLFVLQPWLRSFSRKYWILFALTYLVFVIPGKMLDVSAVESRVGEVSIFGDDPRNPTAGEGLFPRALQFVENTLEHYDFKYLLVDGEFNFRHTTKKFGVLSWLDGSAVALAILLLLLSCFFARLRLGKAERLDYRVPALLGFIGLLSGTMAASLTWDSIPHGLRSLSGWPFAALFTGTCVAYVSRFAIGKFILSAVAAVFVFSFSSYYFFDFRKDADWWFDADVVRALEDAQHSGGQQSFERFCEERHYPALGRKYFELQYFK